MRIVKDTVVRLAYKLFIVDPDQGATLVDEKTEDNPAEFIFGYNTLLPAVESHLLDQGEGLELELKLPPEEAFGDFQPELELWYDRRQLPPGLKLTEGMKFQTQSPDGKTVAVMVKAIDGDQILLDGNHPLAGQTVAFHIQVLSVRKARPEEIASGRVSPSRLH